MKSLIPLFLVSLCLAPNLPADVEVNRAMLGLFKPLAKSAENPDNPFNNAKIKLGRMLYYDPRLSIDHKVSCNTCHDLASFGDDGLPTSLGVGNQKGGRNAPTVYNAAIHIAQFWDGRAPDVETQAVGPVLNPIEMGMPDAQYVLKVVGSIPAYRDLLAKAFPDDKEPLNYDNIGKAIGAFERKLLTPSRFDTFLEGDDDALTDAEKKGFNTFLAKGCATCHNGMGVGGHMFQKLGLVKPWPTDDPGQGGVEGFEAMKGFFKVPSLRNITETAPYLHDGSIASLEEIVKKMAEHQQGLTLTDEETASIITFLKSLKGEIDEDYIAKPELPPGTGKTPKPAKPAPPKNKAE